MKTIYIFFRIYCIDDFFLIYPFRKRKLYNKSVHFFIIVEFCNLSKKLFLTNGVWQPDQRRNKSYFFAVFYLAVDVGFTCAVFTYQNGCQMRRPFPCCCNFFYFQLNFLFDFFGNFESVKNLSHFYLFLMIAISWKWPAVSFETKPLQYPGCIFSISNPAFSVIFCKSGILIAIFADSTFFFISRLPSVNLGGKLMTSYFAFAF